MMKKKGWMLLGLATMLAFTGCGKDGADTPGQETVAQVQGQETVIQVQGQEDSKTAEGDAGSLKPTVTPKPTATPVPTMTPEQKMLATELRDVYKDEVSARMVEKGYFYEVNRTAENEEFFIEFKAVTGDMRNPKLVMDLTVNDEALAEGYEEIKVFAHTLSESAFADAENEWPFDGFGKRDETKRNLYHVIVTGNPYWMAAGDAVVVDICGINFEHTEAYDFEIEQKINLPEFRITVPQYEYHPVPEKGYEELVYEHRGTAYLPEQVVFGQYVTEIRFASYVEEEIVKKYEGGIGQYEAGKQPEWKEFFSGLTLEVDGREYRVKQDGYYLSFSETDSAKGDFKGTGYVEFPGFDILSATEVILWAGTTGYDLKSGSSVPMTRKLPTAAETEKPSLEQKDLAEQVRTLYKDEMSASLIEQGYYQMVNESFTDAIFRFDFKAVTGDKDNRMMLFDVYVDDAVLAASYDKICLRVGCVREENYDPESSTGWNCTGYGYRNEEVGNLYHVVLRGFIFGYAPTMVDVYGVGFDTDTNQDNGIRWYSVNPEGRLVETADEVYCPIPYIQYDAGSMVFTYAGKQYELQEIVFGKYNTEFAFYTDIDASGVPTGSTELWNYREEIQKDWLDFSATLRIVADGVEYPVIDEEGRRGYIWFDVAEGRESYRGNAHPYFPVVDYTEVTEIQIKAGDTVYRIK